MTLHAALFFFSGKTTETSLVINGSGFSCSVPRMELPDGSVDLAYILKGYSTGYARDAGPATGLESADATFSIHFTTEVDGATH